MPTTLDALMLHADDNTATAFRDLKAGETVRMRLGRDLLPFTVTEDIPYGHKFATRDVAVGGDVVKYGEVIGQASAAISAGAHAHVHNVESKRARGDWS